MAWVRRNRVSYIHGLVYISLYSQALKWNGRQPFEGRTCHIRLQYHDFQKRLWTVKGVLSAFRHALQLGVILVITALIP